MCGIAKHRSARRDPVMFVGLVILLVLIGLCVLLGAIYSYIYFTRINPSRSRKFAHAGAEGLQNTSDDSASAATHLFLFRKSNS